MATIKGENLRVFLHLPESPARFACVAASTSCQLHLSLQVEEDTTKDTEDGWIRQTPVGINWDMQVEALIVDNAGKAWGAQKLDVGLLYEVAFNKTTGEAGTQNRNVEESDINMRGNAILNDLQLIAQNNEVSTYTAKFAGVGELWQEQENP